MKNVFYFVVVTLIACNHAQTQNIQKVVLPMAKDSTACYMVVSPKTENVKGALILIAGFGQTAENVFLETKIPAVSYERNMLTVVVSFGKKMYADSLVTGQLNSIIGQVAAKYGVKENFILGGYSIGGAIAVRYTEYCQEHPTQFPIVPKGVFAIDPPIDLIDLWYYFEREINKNFDPAGVEEAKYVSAILRAEIGTPVTNPQGYETLTPFHRNQSVPGNEKYLLTIPVRFYHDVDINWYLQNKRRSIYDCNFLNTSEMVNRLLLMGNARAEFVVGKTGYRSSGLRHPHSWSIVDEADLLVWVNNILQH